MNFTSEKIVTKRVEQTQRLSFEIDTSKLPDGHWRSRVEWHLKNVGDFFERNAATLRQLFGESIVLSLSDSGSAPPKIEAVAGGRGVFTGNRTAEPSWYATTVLERIANYSEQKLGREKRLAVPPRCEMELEDDPSFCNTYEPSDPDERLDPVLAEANRRIRATTPKVEAPDPVIAPSLAAFNERHRSRH